MIFNLPGLQARQTGSSTRTKVLLRAMLLDTVVQQVLLIKQALSPAQLSNLLNKRIQFHFLLADLRVKLAD
jgi:hypothetical protein